VPEGDTIFRTAEVLRRVLLGQTITTADSRPGPFLRRPPDLRRLVGSAVVSVEARGKHLLIGFEADGGEGGPHRFTLRTHMRMTGSWHRYRTGEAWRMAKSRTSVVLETANVVAVCSDCPVAELLTDAELARSRPLRTLGPDLLSHSFGEDAADEAIRRLRALVASGAGATRAATRATSRANAPVSAPIGEALLDQRALAGIGNVVRNEVLFMEGVNPSRPVAEVDDDTLRRLVTQARGVLAANLRGGRRVTTGVDRPGASLWVYGRAGRPCRRCGTLIRAGRQGSLVRTTYWCPRCQPLPQS
jgi:endonuclease VIII